MSATTYNKNPTGLKYIFSLIFMERLTFYGLRALLFVFLLEQLFIDAQESLEIYGSFIALHYATPLIGGWLGDNFLGNQRMLWVSSLLMAVGFLGLMPADPTCFFLGLGALVLASGCFHANLISLMGKLYDKKNDYRDAGFTYYHIFSNVSVVLGPIVFGIIAEVWGWALAFALMAVVMFLTLLLLRAGRVAFGYHGVEPASQTTSSKAGSLGAIKGFFYFALLVAIPAMGFLLWQNEWLGILLPILSIFSLMMLIYIGVSNKTMVAISAILLLMVFNIGFLALFEQAKTHLLLFVNSNADRSFESLFGATLGQSFLNYHEIPLVFFRSLNGLAVIILGPLYAYYWKYLADRRKNPIAPVKFGVGLALAAVAFALLAYSRHFSSVEGYVSLWWVIGTYVFYTAGELCILPIGLAAITRLSSTYSSGVVVAVWLLSGAVALWVAKLMNHFMSSVQSSYDTLCTLQAYCANFGMLAWISLAMSLLILLISPLVRRVFQRPT